MFQFFKKVRDYFKPNGGVVPCLLEPLTLRGLPPGKYTEEEPLAQSQLRFARWVASNQPYWSGFIRPGDYLAHQFWLSSPISQVAIGHVADQGDGTWGGEFKGFTGEKGSRVEWIRDSRQYMSSGAAMLAMERRRFEGMTIAEALELAAANPEEEESQEAPSVSA